MADKPFKIHGSARHFARIAAVQAVYQIEQNPDDRMDVVRQFLLNRFREDFKGSTEPDTQMFITIVEYLQENLNCFDEIIANYLGDGWTLNRLPSLARAVLRCAAYELANQLTVPVPVILNEYVEVAKGFLDQKDVNFIHGVLHNITDKLRSLPS